MFLSAFAALILVSFQTFAIGHVPGNSRLNFFDTDIFRSAAESRKGNVMISPPSIKSTLAMLLEGSRGDTASEISNALRLSPNKEELREQLNKYLSILQSNTSGACVQNANGVFVSRSLRLKKEYDVMLRNVYMSEVTKMNFNDPLIAASNINDWVNRKTMGLIPTVVETVHITPQTDILLLNALYFKSVWKRSFNPQHTHGACFYLRGTCKTVAMMDLHAQLNYAYVENLRCHAVELPYEGDRYSMILLVPQDRDGAASLIRDLPYMNLNQISALMEPSEVQLSMPKFTIDYNEDMVNALRGMHITTLFSSRADLSGIFEGNSTQIDHIFHKVYMTVDETGTIAAAASASLVIPLIQGVVQLRVDRPFIFFIRDNKAGLVLFAGRIEEPVIYQNDISDLVRKFQGNAV